MVVKGEDLILREPNTAESHLCSCQAVRTCDDRHELSFRKLWWIKENYLRLFSVIIFSHLLPNRAIFSVWMVTPQIAWPMVLCMNWRDCDVFSPPFLNHNYSPCTTSLCCEEGEWICQLASHYLAVLPSTTLLTSYSLLLVNPLLQLLHT